MERKAGTVRVGVFGKGERCKVDGVGLGKWRWVKGAGEREYYELKGVEEDRSLIRVRE